MRKDISLVGLDLDGTLIKENSWETLNVALGITPEEDKALFRAYATNELSYDAWMKELSRLYRVHGRANQETIADALSSYTYQPYAKEMVAYLKKEGYILALITGSFDVLAQSIAQELDIPHAHGCATFVFNEKGEFEELESEGDEARAKLLFLESLAKELSIPLEKCAYIGDGGNDVGIFRKTGRGITFSSSKVEKDAWQTISSFVDIPAIF